MNTPLSSRTSVLVVEDDLSVRRFLVYALQHLGFRVSECEDVSAAERFLNQVSPQIVLADCNLPHSSGTDLVRWAHDERADLPVIGMSAEHFKGDEMLDAGAVDFLPKPIDLNMLRDMLERHKITVGRDEPEERKAPLVPMINGVRPHPTDAPRAWMRASRRTRESTPRPRP